ncbi:helix-turn-helix domain-containing protein [Aestuariivirga sp.]|uniref:helix-turn-helix domain-containing protein n=1 Tax=Aestuariivirga sp. TaxID=2650926 RepID=UPI003BA8BBD7
MTEFVPFVLSVAEAARCANLGRTSLYAAIASGMLKTRKAGRRTLIEVTELRRFIESLPLTGRSNDAA